MPADLEDDDLMQDSDEDDDESDEVPSDLDAESDEEVEADDDDAAEAESDEEADEADDDALSLVEDSDAEDLLPLDTEVPMGLIEFDGPEDEDADEGEEWGGISATAEQPNGKRKRDDGGRRAQRKKLRALPTFASYEDYAKMIEDGPEDNI